MLSLIISIIGSIALIVTLLVVGIYGYFKICPLPDENQNRLTTKGLKIAHGGVLKQGVRPNTLSAVQLAYQTDGIDGVEIDAQMSADGVLFTEHDPELVIKETGETLPYRTMTFDEIQAKLPDASRLEDILVFCKEHDFYLNIEIKPWFKRMETAKKVAMLTQKHPFYDKCWISAFHPELLYQVKKTDKNITTGYLNGNYEIFQLTGFPWKKMFHAYQMTLLVFRAFTLSFIKPSFIHLNTEELSYELLSFFSTKRNKHIVVWTENDDKLIKKHLDNNRSVITDIKVN